MHAYQIIAVTLNIILVDVRNYYLSIPSTILFPGSYIILLKREVAKSVLNFSAIPTQWSKDNLNTVTLASDFNYSKLQLACKNSS